MRLLRYSAPLWSIGETFVYPVLLLVLTPVLLKTIDVHGYAIWVLAYSIAGFGSVANLGMGLATQRFVAQARGGERGSASMEKAAVVIAQSMLLAGVGGAVLGAVLLLAARPLAEVVFPKMGTQDHVILAIQVAGIIVACQQIESVLASGLRGLERFDMAAKAEAITKAVGGVAQISMALWSRSVDAVLVVTAASAVVAVLVKGILLRRTLEATIRLRCWRFPDRATLHFALWTWLQGISGTVFQQADRILVSTVLGAAALSNYSVASQVGALVHAGLSAMFAVVFPRLSRQMATGDGKSRYQRFSESWHRFAMLNVVCVIALGTVLWFLGPGLIHLWLGDAATAEVLRIYPMVLTAFLILSVNIAPHFVLLGAGSARYISMSNAVAALVALVALYPAVSLLGVDGAALSRAAYGLVLIVSYFGIFRRLPISK